MDLLGTCIVTNCYIESIEFYGFAVFAAVKYQKKKEVSVGRILLVDDDARLGSLLSRFLGEQKFDTSLVANGREMYHHMESTFFDLLILDINLPGEDGLTICKQLRRRGNRIPIIMLTARGDAADRIIGLELGADDYLTKPFNPKELLARIRAVLRRQPSSKYELYNAKNISYKFGGFILSAQDQILYKGSDPLHLSTAELALLRLFLTAVGQPLSRDQIVLNMASREHQQDQRAIDMLVSRLRKRLDSPSANASMIRTVRGIGYVFVAEVIELAEDVK